MFQREVYSFLYRYGVPRHACDDMFQDIFLRVHRNSHLYDPAQPLAPWLFTIVANRTRDYFRKQRHVDRLISTADDRLHPPTAHEESVALETARWLEQKILELPSDQRELVLLCNVKGLCQKDVAVILGLPVNTVKTQIRRARLDLARSLAARNAKIKREGTS